MSTSPIDSVFGVPERPGGARPEAPISDIANHRHADAAEAARSPGTEVEWANSELLTIASTIEELQGRLEQANSRLAGAGEGGNDGSRDRKTLCRGTAVLRSIVVQPRTQDPRASL